MRQLTLVSFPGVLRDDSDPSTAIAALGGANAVRAATRLSDHAESLSLNLRPGDEGSASHIGSQPIPVTGQFALRVFVAGGAVRPVILGRVVRALAFPGLSDFQYVGDRTLRAAAARLAPPAPALPAPPSAAGSGGAAAWAGAPDRAARRRGGGGSGDGAVRGGALRTAAAQRVSAALRRGLAPSALSSLEELRPLRFARAAAEPGGPPQWFRQHSGGGAGAMRLGGDRRSDRARLSALPHKVALGAAAVPAAPPPAAQLPAVERSQGAFDALVAQLRALFARRPVWMRRALLAHIPPQARHRFKKAVPHVSFSFVGPGPFFAAWVRYGFDPRTDPPANRRFQVVEVRAKHPVVLEAMRAQARDVRARGAADYDCFAPDSTLAECPTRKNLFLQLCDVQIDEVQALIRDEPFPPKFSQKTGHFTQEGIHKVHAAVRKGLYALAERKIGTERTKRILTELSLKKKKRRLGRRSVLDTNFHRTGRLSEQELERKRKSRRRTLEAEAVNVDVSANAPAVTVVAGGVDLVEEYAMREDHVGQVEEVGFDDGEHGGDDDMEHEMGAGASGDAGYEGVQEVDLEAVEGFEIYDDVDPDDVGDSEEDSEDDEEDDGE